MLEIDGSEAGGQILRTASALSALTGKSFKIINIRGARPQPGLKTQHLEGLKAVAELCNAKVKGASLGSKELEFVPEKLQCKDIEVNISTAGSIGLVLQSLSIIAPGLSDHIHVNFKGGGTWNNWAPPVIYLEKIFNQFINIFAIEIERDGFYPKGEAIVSVIIDPYEKKKIDIPVAGKIKKFVIYSVASRHLEKADVAKRQAEEAKNLLENKFDVPIDIKFIRYKESMSPGSGILVVARTENSFLGGDAIGERGKSAENVAKEAVRNLISELDGSVDRHMADMLLPFMALSGGKIKTPQITQHILTNIKVIEQFLDVKFRVEGEKGQPGIIAVA